MNDILISIVVPYHNETPEQIKPLMRSLNQQVGIDYNKIEILLCNDMIDEVAPLDDYDFTEYENLSSRIRKVKSQYKENPGMSRQAGIDDSKGDYVFFCDADDCLYHVGVLRKLFENINNSHANVYRFKFIEEIGSFEDDSFLTYQIIDYNWVWVFAKAYKVDFLRKNHIRFNPKNRWHEDTYFNLLCQYCQPNQIDIDSVGYLWRFSKTSVTRVNDHEYTFNSIDEYLTSVGLAYDIIMKEYNQNCSIDILKVIVTRYLELENPINFGKEKYEYIEHCCYNFIKEFGNNLFGDFDKDIEAAIANILSAYNSPFLPSRTFKQYLQDLKNKYEENNTANISNKKKKKNNQ